MKTSTTAGVGVGVFATAAIAKGTRLAGLFAGDDGRRLTWAEFAALDVPADVKDPFATRYEGECFVPRDFNRVSVGWYLNDSPDPTAARDADYE